MLGCWSRPTLGPAHRLTYVCPVLPPRTAAVDRLYLNLYVPELQRVGQVVGFLTRHLGFEIPSTAVIAPRSKAFVKRSNASPTTIGCR